MPAWDWRLQPRRTLRTLAWGLLISLGIHLLLMWVVPKPEQKIETGMAGGPPAMEVVLAPESQPPRADTAPPPARAVEPKPLSPRMPRVIAVPKATPNAPVVPLVPEEPPKPIERPVPITKDAPPIDFMAALNARRAQRQAVEDELARQNAAARAGEREATAAEKAAAGFKQNMQSMGRGRDGTSGVFQIQSKGTRYAAFSFRGWTTDKERSKYQLIEVDAGIGGDVDQAIVRRMIELIRTHYQGDFNWDSQRLGRVVVLSARKEDTAGLEAFLLREFFG
jgi:hypothetical protein